ncbi:MULTISPECIES: sulfite exporter TauE/SafE family protein [Candidatus Ichthyocystis]|uniref:sulfite exporter TauE/SafE family protein n=1 Tax=Candidatus Ichthyocystis TaxID=2929841 RepID=UPI000B874652|nr:MULTISPECIES: sulfite exporter TauE/SafE family protein [Ichthyocystis]
MDISLGWILYYVVAGLVTGFISNITGLGGGIISVSVLTHAFYLQNLPKDESYRIALATSAVLTLISSLSNAYFNFKKRNFKWKLVKRYFMYVFIGSTAGATISHNIPIVELKLIFIAICLMTVTKMFWQKKVTNQDKMTIPLEEKKTSGLLFGISGVISSLVSVGGGAIYVPLLNAHRIEMAQVVGTSSLLVLTTATGTILGHAIGNINNHNVELIKLHIVVYMGIAVLIGSRAGALVLNRIPAKWIKITFLAALITSMAKMAYGLI